MNDSRAALSYGFPLRLVRLGYGVYGRAVVSRLTGEPLLYSANGFLGAARQALTKLGVS
jgi:hypothetical protein